MKLINILNGLNNYKIKGNQELEIANIANDSRKVTPNSLFVAIRGYNFDGHDFIAEAIKNGAIAVMLDMSADLRKVTLPQGITVVIIQDTRLALAISSCNFYGNPSRYFKLIGVTGTKGKTSTTFMIKSILEKAGKRVGLIGTIQNYIGDQVIEKTDNTTPESIDLQRMFYQMARARCEYVVMEVSSQSLKLNRVAGSYFDYGIFTNFNPNHISKNEHENVDDYFNSKLRLFTMCKYGVVNFDDFKGIRIFNTINNCEFSTYSVDNSSDFIAKDITITNATVDFKVKLDGINERIKVNIPGRYSVYNALAAIAFAKKENITADIIKQAMLELVIPGRNENIPNDKELAIMIDFANTPESLEGLLKATKTYTKGDIICVFGCEGDCDTSKREKMGEISGRNAALTIITSNNPRNEDPNQIIEQVKKGMAKTKGKFLVIPDREKAIAEAIRLMNRRDIVIIAGKGHNKFDEVKGEKIPFDEREIAAKYIALKKAPKK